MVNDRLAMICTNKIFGQVKQGVSPHFCPHLTPSLYMDNDLTKYENMDSDL